MKHKTLDGLQVLRGLAALVVVIGHAEAMGASSKYTGVQAFGGLTHIGAFGVDLFFILSGFVITYVCLDATTLRPKVTLREFWYRRFTRIIPMMWIAIWSYAALRMVGGRDVEGLETYVAASVLSPYGLLEPRIIWTLRHEFIFYAVFALAFLSARRRLWALALFVGAPFLYDIVTNINVPDRFSALYVVRVFAHPVNIEFLSGVAVAILYMRSEGFRGAHAGRWALPLLLALFCGVFAALYRIGLLHENGIAALTTTALLLPLFGLALVMNLRGRWYEQGLLLLGNASYSIYLFHPHVESAVLGLGRRFAPGAAPWMTVLAASVAALLAGIVLHLLLERPLLQWLMPRTKRLFSVGKPG